MLKRVLQLAVPAALAAGVLLPVGTAGAATPCPATFQVLHNDRIGAMALPAGPYRVTVNRLGCASASRLFAQFLQDYDGVLPVPWTDNAARRSFTNGRASFSVRPVSSPNPPSPPAPPAPAVCPGTFSVLHNDRIGPLAFPKGRYTITVLTGTAGEPCSTAASDFARFLEYPTGDLPAPWTMLPTESPNPGAFFNDVPGDRSFRVDRVGGGTGGGGHTGGTSCGPFRVLHNDNIGSLYLPRGPYNVIIPTGSTMSCTAASARFTRFLDAAALPRTWALDTATATFTQRSNSRISFRIKPLAGAVR